VLRKADKRREPNGERAGCSLAYLTLILFGTIANDEAPKLQVEDYSSAGCPGGFRVTPPWLRVAFSPIFPRATPAIRHHSVTIVAIPGGAPS
jgi:hypothetical protein